MALEFEDHPFWDFSLRVYGTNAVSEACIGLQERRGIDVNLVLLRKGYAATPRPGRSGSSSPARSAA